MKFGRYILGIVFLSFFILFALENDDLIRLSFPSILGTNTGRIIYLPMYLFASLAMFVGIAIGIFIEYLRNFKLRKDFNEKRRKLSSVEKELKLSKEKFLTEDEKIFNLLD